MSVTEAHLEVVGVVVNVCVVVL